MELQQLELDHSPGTNSTIAAGCCHAGTIPASDLILASNQAGYHCPGELHPVSYSVHLARLAAGYAACRNCHHNQAIGQSQITVPSATRERTVRPSLVSPIGVRGIYLNEIDRTRASDWGAAFASYLWDQQPRVGRRPPSDHAIKAVDADVVVEPTAAEASIAIPPPTVRKGPVVVIGFDERPSSPDIIVGVSLGLRRMGCHVIDLGQATRPSFHFAVHHLEAAGGVFVTGDGCDPAWTGFHFAGLGAMPWLRMATLCELEQRVLSKVVRPTRTAGTQRPFHASVPYHGGLWKLFHALRPLQIVCGVATRQLPRTLESLFSRLPCRLMLETLPVRKRDLSDPQDPDVQRIAAATMTGQHHLGLIIDDDGERCAFVTETGQLVAPAELARLLVQFELHEYRSARVVTDDEVFSKLATSRISNSPACQIDQEVPAEIPGTMMQLNAGLGITADHRVWFGGDYPVCNAIMTLARVLQALSLSDATMSEVLQRTV